MIIECLKCRRRIPGDGTDQRVSHTYCVRCYALFPECNGGIDWRNATDEELEELKNDISQFLEKDARFVGEPAIVWPEDGLRFVESIIQELNKEREEPRDGSRR